MPIHDWTRVRPGIFHDFHTAWLVEIRNCLNGGLLPGGYYALAEQDTGDFGPDVLTLQTAGSTDVEVAGALAIATAPPRVRVTAQTDRRSFVRRKKRLAIRHVTGDRIVALVEIVSRGNKSSRDALRTFVDQAVDFLERGHHLLLVDLYPPTRRDPNGLHGAIWSKIGDRPYVAPPDKPLTVAAYSGGIVKNAYVEPVGVADPLPDMPLFLDPDHYVPVPLEASYGAAWRGVPERWRAVLEPQT